LVGVRFFAPSGRFGMRTIENFFSFVY